MCHGTKRSELFTMTSLYKYFTRDLRAHFQFGVHSHQMQFFNACQRKDLWKIGNVNGSSAHCWIGLICNDKVDQALFFHVNEMPINAQASQQANTSFDPLLCRRLGVGDLDTPSVGNYKSHHAPACQSCNTSLDMQFPHSWSAKVAYSCLRPFAFSRKSGEKHMLKINALQHANVCRFTCAYRTHCGANEP